uniref:Uncharacterized protein n=1 Tax=Myotis myotis TaxID=51298 RepID=A0A7J7SR12_MYOMY|nr:hypothetical protein mMyoMyo1_009287 [Myotis myotis]
MATLSFSPRSEVCLSTLESGMAKSYGWAGGPVTNVTQAEMGNPWAWDCPLLLFLGTWQLPPGEGAGLSRCMMGERAQFPLSLSDCRHEGTQLKPAEELPVSEPTSLTPTQGMRRCSLYMFIILLHCPAPNP